MVPLFRLSGWSFVAAIVAFFAMAVVSAIEPHFGLPVLYVMVWCAVLSFFFLWGALIAALSPPK
ncbi:hypothetical protein [Cryobacterium psychrophilum]|uniref:Uncharacterized protein n=1 Tax=Cryobacterium psychrophilum TaxID=41988 RepID=A0A4Y8KMS2_9MICO|nr:hypothetical protein [Cryobacterium psychrophilum]TDW30362.1 hypothetical protein EDD25_2113 [Cryobacterium psychrophilum]TFD79057.1 hypothetical protein E3T53_08115 [Cryobacterium psychrophilum]